MLRALLLGLLASTLPSCAHHDDATVEPLAPAGKVVELTGTVSASHGGTARTLTLGDVVSGDDVIATGADGRISIVLAHNHARWELGPGKQTKVSESLAWALARQDGSAVAVDQASSAAGRVAERSAAETTASTTTDDHGPAPGAAPDVAPTPSRHMAVDKGSAIPPPPPPPPPPTIQPDSSGPPPAPMKPITGTREGSEGKKQLPALHALLEHDRAALEQCLDAAAPRLTLELRVANGVWTIVGSGAAPSAATTACFTREVKALQHASPDLRDAADSIELVKH